VGTHREPLIVQEVVDGAAFITLNRPEKLNALTRGMLDDLLEALRDAARDPHVHVAVVRGAGRAFCTGHDLADLQLEDVSQEDMLKAQQR
jgi:enoyl-CoA hydratase/carnithine racemase